MQILVVTYKLDFPTIRLGDASITSNATSSASTSSPSAITGLSDTCTLTETHKVRAILSAKSLYNTSSSTYNVLMICNGTVSAANQIGVSNNSLANANAESVAIVICEVTLDAGTYTFNGGMSRNSGTMTLSATTTQPAILTVDVVG